MNLTNEQKINSFLSHRVTSSRIHRQNHSAAAHIDRIGVHHQIGQRRRRWRQQQRHQLYDHHNDAGRAKVDRRWHCGHDHQRRRFCAAQQCGRVGGRRRHGRRVRIVGIAGSGWHQQQQQHAGADDSTDRGRRSRRLWIAESEQAGGGKHPAGAGYAARQALGGLWVGERHAYGDFGQRGEVRMIGRYFNEALHLMG